MPMHSSTRPQKDPTKLRSNRWFGPDDVRSFGHRSRLKGIGVSDKDYRNKPVIAILNTWSDLNTCHSHLRQRAEEVKRGVWQEGGFPVEVPVMSLGEMLMKPTTMLYRNLLAMETEEVLRCHPIDGAVLMGGCDKTTPALLMGAITMNIPVIYLPAGAMLKARWGKETLGSGSDVWKYWAERCAGNLCDESWHEIENSIARSPRCLYDDGHSVDDDVDRGIVGNESSRCIVRSRCDFRALQTRHGNRTHDCRHGVG